MEGPVLITGATGFVGRRLVSELGRRETAVIAVGEQHEAGIVACDLRNRDAVHELIRRHGPATIVHLAAMSSVGQAGGAALQTWDINVGGTFNLASACVAQETDMRFVFASSAEVYGASFLDGACDEDAPLMPLSTYARSKATAEWLLHDLASPSFQVLIARPFNHIGPGQDSRFVVPSFAAQIAAAGSEGVVRVGNLDAVRDFSDVDDLVEAFTTLVVAAFGPMLGIFNIGSNNPRSIRSVLDELIALSGAQIKVELDPQRLRPSDIPVARGMFDRFNAAFGQRPRRPLGETLHQVLAEARTRLGRTPGEG